VGHQEVRQETERDRPMHMWPMHIPPPQTGQLEVKVA